MSPDLTTLWSSVTWDTARAGGFAAYGLLTASVAIGLALSLKWRSERWPRFITTDLHRFVTLLALVFTGIHTLAVALDPFIGYTPVEVLIPLVSHYRPLWVALGIVASYLLVALWVSEWIRPRVGYAWWRRFHYLSFVGWLLAVIHGIATGSDTRTPWALALYGGSLVLGGMLVAVRLFPEDPRLRRHPFVAVASAAVLLLLSGWIISGPLQPGWNAVANNGQGRGQAAISRTVAAASDPSGSPSPQPSPSAEGSKTTGSGGTDPFASPFRVAIQGTVTTRRASDGSAVLVLDADVANGQGRLTIMLPLQAGNAQVASTAPLTLASQTTGATCQGQLTEAEGDRLDGVCRTPAGLQLALTVRVTATDGGAVSGTLTGRPA